LAQYGKNAIGKLKAALIISVPINIFEATKSIEKPYLNLMLNKYLCDNLQRILRSHVDDKVFPELDLKEVYKVIFASASRYGNRLLFFFL
jgi:abhydrolase domain-containing protein 1/3